MEEPLLFSHPVKTEQVTPPDDTSPAVQNPVFSDQPSKGSGTTNAPQDRSSR